MNRSQAYKVARKYKLYILSSIFDSENDCYFTDKDKALKHFNDTFHSEYGYRVKKRLGPVTALKEYLQGLPSCINIDFMNYDILKRAEEYGVLTANSTEKEKDDFLNNYFNYMANQLHQMIHNTLPSHQPTQEDLLKFMQETALLFN